MTFNIDFFADFNSKLSVGRIWIMVFLGFGFGSASQEFPSRSSSGIYKEELPAPIMYESVIPIVLEYTLPKWNKSEVTFNNWYNCTSEVAPYRYTCPIVYHMNQATLNLHIDFNSLQPVQDQVPHTEFYSKLQSGMDYCDTVQKHFSANYIQQSELNTYIQSLEKCQAGSNLIHLERELQDYNFTIRAPFTTMENRFYNTFYKGITAASLNGSLDLVGSATLSNARTTIQAQLLAHFYAEKNRWTHALHDCRAQTLPHSIVTNEKFQNTLDVISKRSQFLEWSQFAIPMSLMSKYYNLPIADCSFTNTSFVVRILVPINKKTSRPEALKLYKISPVPFSIQGQLCTVQLTQQVFLYDTDRELAFKTSCKPNELCKIAKGYNMADLDLCASALLSENFNDTKANCPFKCYSYQQANVIEERGIITRVASDEYVLNGKSGTVATVKCPSDTAGVEIIFQNEETLELALPCGCNIRLDPNHVYYSEAPCAIELTITHLVPWHLLKRIEDVRPDANELARITSPFNSRIPSTNMNAESFTGQMLPSSTVVVEESSHAVIWILFSITTLALLLGQLYLFYEVKQVRGVNSAHQNWLYRGARDSEAEARLIDQRLHI